MLRFLPLYTRSFVSHPVLNFVPTSQTDYDLLDARLWGFGRRRSQSLMPDIYIDDPLAEVNADTPSEPPPPKKKQKSPEKRPSPKKETTLPTPTDVPVPEPWDIPPPDPKDPRPKSVP